MADEISEWSTTAGNNTSLGAVSLLENVMTVKSVNNGFRELMAQVATGISANAFMAAYTAASASGAASIKFAEDTDNGTSVTTLQGAASLAGDITLTLPSTAGTLALTTDGPDLSAVDQDIIPDADSTRDLGDSTHAWAEVHADEVLTPAIQFPATQVPSADANTLDDYEEGTYTPTWSSSGTAVSLGDGTVSGAYTKMGNTVIVHTLKLTMGSTTTFGTGEYYLTVPFTAAASGAVGSARANDSGSRAYAGICQLFNTTQIRSLGDVGSGANWGQLVPHTWANTDFWENSIIYTV